VTDEISQADLEYIERTLEDIKEHYKEWVNTYSPIPLDLCQFAYYEQCEEKECCKEILKRGSPIALGSELVSKGVCEWVKFNGELALKHKNLGILTFKEISKGAWFSEEGQPEEYWTELMKKMSPGEIIANSFDKLVDA
jgi:hypothetical protein